MSFAAASGRRRAARQPTLNDFVTQPGDPDFAEGSFSSQAQFPAAAAEKRLLENQSRAFKTASLMQELGLEVPDDVAQIAQKGFLEDKPNFFERILQGLVYPGNVVKLGIQDVLTGDMGPQEIGFADILKTAGQLETPENIEAQREQFGFSTSGSDLLSTLGVPEAESGAGKVARGVAHFFVDVATDPLSYLTFGASGLGRKVLGETAEAASHKAALNASIGLADNAFSARWADNYSKLVTEATDAVMSKYSLFDDTGEVIADLIDDIGMDVIEDEIQELALKWTTAGIQDELIAPLIARDFGALPKDALELPFEILPAYARGGARVSVPFFGVKSLKYGLEIPNTVGAGRKATAPFRAVINKVKEDTTLGRFLSTTLESVRANIDLDRALLKGVKEGKIKGHEWALIRQSMVHSGRFGQVSEFAAQTNTIFNRFVEIAQEADVNFDDVNRVVWSAINEPEAAFKSRLQTITDGLDETSAIRLTATVNEFAERVKVVSKDFTEQLSRYDPKFAAISPDRTMYVGIDPSKRDTLRLMAEKGILPDPQDQSYGAWVVRRMMRSVQFGGSGEAAFGSTSHLLSQDFGLSPIVSLSDDPAGFFLDLQTMTPNAQTQIAAGNLQAVADQVEPNRFISAVELNDQIEGVITEMVGRARGQGVPLSSKETGRLFIEDPFQSFVDYSRDVLNTLTMLDLTSTLDEIGLAQAKSSVVDFQRAVNNMAEALQDPNIRKHLEQKAKELGSVSPTRLRRVEQALGERAGGSLPTPDDGVKFEARYGPARPAAVHGITDMPEQQVFKPAEISSNRVVRDTDAYRFKYGNTTYEHAERTFGEARGAVIGPKGEIEPVLDWATMPDDLKRTRELAYESAGEEIPTQHGQAYANLRRRKGDIDVDPLGGAQFADDEDYVTVVDIGNRDGPRVMSVLADWDDLTRQQQEQILELARAHKQREIGFNWETGYGTEYDRVIRVAQVNRRRFQGALNADDLAPDDPRFGRGIQSTFGQHDVVVGAVIDLDADSWVPLRANTFGKTEVQPVEITELVDDASIQAVKDGRQAIVTIQPPMTLKRQAGVRRRVKVTIKDESAWTPRLQEDLRRFAIQHGQNDVWVQDASSRKIARMSVDPMAEEISLDIATAGRAARQLVENKLANLNPRTQQETLDLLKEQWGSEAIEELFDITVDAVQFNDRVHKLHNIVEELISVDPGVRHSGQLLEDSGEQLLFNASQEQVQLLKEARHLAGMLGLNDFQVGRRGFNLKSATEEFVSREGFVDPHIFNVGGAALRGKQVQEDVARWMEQLVRNMRSIYTPVGLANLKEMNSDVLRWWKGMATITRPTFHIRNLIGGVWNNQIIGVRARDYRRIANNAVKFRQWMREMSTEDALARLGREAGDETRRVFEQAYRTGVLDASFTRTEYRAVREGTRTQAGKILSFANPFSPDDFGLVRGGAFAMESIEDFLRLSAFSAWLDVTDDAAAAATAKVAKEMSIAVHFDYSHLTEFETMVKQFVPFFVWQRRNIPLQLAVMMERPGLMTRYAHLMSAVQNQEAEVYDDFPRNDFWTAFASPTGAVLHEGTPFWARLMFDPDLPVTDLFNSLDPLSPGESMRNMFDLIGPQFTLPFDLMEQGEYGDVNAPAPLNVIARQLAVLGLFDERVTEEGDFRIPYSVRTIWNTVFPFAREVVETPIGPTDPRQAARLGDTPEDQSMLRRIGLTAARGAGIQLQTPALARSSAYRADQELSKVLERIQLSTSITPEDKEDFDKRYRGFQSGRN